MTELRAETLLVELLTEELPPKALKRLGDAFAAGNAAAHSEALLPSAPTHRPT
jgi:glycyl-tRNA synthetase beta subunit